MSVLHDEAAGEWAALVAEHNRVAKAQVDAQRKAKKRRR